MFVRFVEGSSTEEGIARVEATGLRYEGPAWAGGPHLFRLQAGATPEETRRVVEAVRAFDSVRECSPNFTCRAAATVPNDEFWGRQRWHYEMIQLPDAWDVTTGRTTVVVAVVDTGVRFDHGDLTPNLLQDGWDFIDDDADPTDQNGHGTHVAGTIGASSNDGRGVAGVAWSVRILPVRVLGAQGGGSDLQIANGIRYAAGLPNSSGRLPRTPARIINLSLAACAELPATRDAIADALRAGCIVVAAAGNNGDRGEGGCAVNAINYPAAYPGVIGVGSVGPDRRRAPYSNFAGAVDFVMPGGNTAAGAESGILSTSFDPRQGLGYTYLQGTSMATPHLAGVLALMLSVNPNLSLDAVNAILNASAEDLGAAGFDAEYGQGLVSARRAVIGARDGVNSIPGTPVRPAPVDVGAIFVVALDDAGNVVAETQTTAADGYRYVLDLPPGTYTIVAGVDRNNNGILREPGELFGTHPVRVEVQRGQMIDGINIVVR